MNEANYLNRMVMTSQLTQAPSNYGFDAATTTAVKPKDRMIVIKTAGDIEMVVRDRELYYLLTASDHLSKQFQQAESNITLELSAPKDVIDAVLHFAIPTPKNATVQRIDSKLLDEIARSPGLMRAYFNVAIRLGVIKFVEQLVSHLTEKSAPNALALYAWSIDVTSEFDVALVTIVRDIITQPCLNLLLNKGINLLYQPSILNALPFAVLHTLLRNNHLNVSSEDEVALLCIAWLRALKWQRMTHAKELLTQVTHLATLTHCCAKIIVQQLNELEEHELAMQVDALFIQEKLSISNDMPSKLRYSRQLHVIVGGDNFAEDDFAQPVFYAYNQASNSIVSLLGGCPVTITNTLYHRRHCLEAIGSKLYAIGGDGALPRFVTPYAAQTNCIDLARGSIALKTGEVTYSWKIAAHLHQERSQACSVVCNGQLYVMGGVDSFHNSRLDSVEKYSPKDNQWLLCASMNTPRSAFAACVLTCTELNNRPVIVVSGGFDGLTTLNTVEYYDPALDQWTRIDKTLNKSRQSHTMTADQDGNLWVVGGSNMLLRLADAEYTTSLFGHWKISTTVELALARSQHIMLTIDRHYLDANTGHLKKIQTFLVIGGEHSAGDATNLCEWLVLSYDEKFCRFARSFLPEPPTLPRPLTGLAGATIDDIDTKNFFD